MKYAHEGQLVPEPSIELVLRACFLIVIRNAWPIKDSSDFFDMLLQVKEYFFIKRLYNFRYGRVLNHSHERDITTEFTIMKVVLDILSWAISKIWKGLLLVVTTTWFVSNYLATMNHNSSSAFARVDSRIEKVELKQTMLEKETNRRLESLEESTKENTKVLYILKGKNE